MAATVGVTLGDLIDQTLGRLVTPREYPLRVEVDADPLSALASDTSVSVTEPDKVEPTDVLEFGYELLLVTGKDSVSDLLTVSRGYMGTDLSAHVTGEVGWKSPQWPRWRVRQHVLNAVSGGILAAAPEVATETGSVLTGGSLVPVAADTLDVIRVQVMDDQGRLVGLSRWDFMDHLPADMFPTGKVVQINSGPSDDDVFWVTSIRPYRWFDTDAVQTSDPDDDAVVYLPADGVDLPMLWAAATLATGRELSRSELDKVEEWNQEQAIRQGTNLRLVKELWGEFYRRSDEVRRNHPVQRHRPFQRMRGF